MLNVRSPVLRRGSLVGGSDVLSLPGSDRKLVAIGNKAGPRDQISDQVCLSTRLLILLSTF